jgi:hypothetical protein
MEEIMETKTLPVDIDEMVDHYLTAGLWSTPMPDFSGRGGNGMMDDWYDEGDCVNYEDAYAECESFVRDNADDLALIMRDHGATAAQIGHDFLLTRDGHGAGFWGRGYGPTGDRLTEACRPYGNSEFFPEGWAEATDEEVEMFNSDEPSPRGPMESEASIVYVMVIDDGFRVATIR